jgi:hypothetical protein
MMNIFLNNIFYTHKILSSMSIRYYFTKIFDIPAVLYLLCSQNILIQGYYCCFSHRCKTSNIADSLININYFNLGIFSAILS